MCINKILKEIIQVLPTIVILGLGVVIPLGIDRYNLYPIISVDNFFRIFKCLYIIFTSTTTLIFCCFVFISIILYFFANVPGNAVPLYSFYITFYGYLGIINYYNILLNYDIFKLYIKLNFWLIFAIIIYIFLLITPFFIFDGLINNFLYHYQYLFNDYILYMDSSGGGNPDPSGGIGGSGTGGTSPPNPNPNPNPNLDSLTAKNTVLDDNHYKQYTKNRCYLKPRATFDFDVPDKPDEKNDNIRSFRKFANKEEAERYNGLKNIAILKGKNHYLLLKKHEVFRSKDIGQDFNPFSYKSISSALNLEHKNSSNGVHTYSGVLNNVFKNVFNYTISFKDGKFLEASAVEPNSEAQKLHFKRE